MPVDATGSYDFGLEGNITVNNVRFPAKGPVVAAGVTDAQPVARRVIVEDAACNRCHNDLQGHGGNRRGLRACTQCHNAENVNDERIARFEGSVVDVQSVDLKVMIHKIHRGEGLTQEYVLGGNPTPNADNPAGTPVNFGETRYPGHIQACTTCHNEGTFQLPLANARPTRREILTCTEDPAADTNSLCATRAVEARYIPPETAVCTSCHDTPEVAAHAAVMTTGLGNESCATCHGPGSAFDPAVVHTLDPTGAP
jgi:OmcA/MtrC family decaheme c-type cytochrome